MKGVVTIDPLYATPKRQRNLAFKLEQHGFQCEIRQRFDGLRIVAFEKDKVDDDPEEVVYQLLRNENAWHNHDCKIRILES